jgi:nucleoid-associated protein YgaU
MRIDENSHVLWSTEGVRPVKTSVRRSWMVLAASVATLAFFAGALPAPWKAVDLLVNSNAPASVAGAIAVSQNAVLTVASTTIWVLLLWAAVVAAVAVLGSLPGAAGNRWRRILGFIAPGVARNLLLTVLGASLASGLAGCATGAATVSAHSPSVAATRSWIAVEGSASQLRAVVGVAQAAPDDPHAAPKLHALDLDVDWPETSRAARLVQQSVDVDWPAAASATPKSPRRDPVDVDWPSRPTAAQPAAAKPVVVVRGDTLWAIAARHLPATASASDIDQAWHQWYSANIAAIGSDPDLILPGQILLPPTQNR